MYGNDSFQHLVKEEEAYRNWVEYKGGGKTSVRAGGLL